MNTHSITPTQSLSCAVGMATHNNSSAVIMEFEDSNITDVHSARNQNLVQVEVAVLGLIFTLAVLGNCLVLFLLAAKRSKFSRMNIMIVHLSLADLFVALCNILPQLVWDITGEFQGGDFLCRGIKYLQGLAMYASSYVLITTAIDRWLVICHPLTSHTWSNRRLHLMVAVAWIVAMAFSLPQAILFSLKEKAPGQYDCWVMFDPEWTLQLYITWVTVAVYILPTLILVLTYGRICFQVWSSMRSKEPSSKPQGQMTQENGRLLMTSCNNGPRAHVRGLSRAKFKTVKLTLTVIICYLLCWGPFFVAQMWAAWDENAPFEGDAMVVIMLLASLNSCANPWIFLAFSTEACGSLRVPPTTRSDRPNGRSFLLTPMRTRTDIQALPTTVSEFVTD